MLAQAWQGTQSAQGTFLAIGGLANPGEEELLVLAPAWAVSCFELPAYSSLNFPTLLGASRPGFQSPLWLPSCMVLKQDTSVFPSVKWE